MEIAGSGALNLDHVYELSDLSAVRQAGFRLRPGMEISGTADEALRLHAVLGAEGRLLARSGGGSAANTICILAALGHDTAFIGTAGDDEAGEFILTSMQGVDCSMVRRAGRSGECIVIIEEHTRDRAMFVVPGSAPPELPVDPDISSARMLHMSSLAVEEGPAMQEQLVSLLKPDQILSFDPGELYARRGMQEILPLFSRTDLLFITSEELKMLDRASEGYAVYQKLNHRRAAPVMVVKQGSHGAAAFIRGQDWFQPAAPVKEVVDNTGAGDAFAAGFIHGILAGRPVTECLSYGARIAAVSLSAYGRNWLSSLESLKERFDV